MVISMKVARYKVKVKLSLCEIKPYAIIACEGVDPFLTSTLCGGKWLALLCGCCIPEEKAPIILLSRKLCGYHSRTGRFEEEDNPLCPIGYCMEPRLHCCRACCLVTTTTELALLQVDT
jgi:hypothetical protein